MTEFDNKKFEWKDLVTNNNGKNSGSGFIGVILGLLTAVFICIIMYGFLVGLDNTIEMFEKVLQLGFLVGVLLGTRKVTSVFEKKD